MQRQQLQYLINYHVNYTEGQYNLPRKEYKTITVNVDTFLRFIDGVSDARKTDSKVNNSNFLESLLDCRTMKSDLSF